MNELETLRQIVADMLRYTYTFLAKVIDNHDPEQNSRIKVIIPALGILTEGVWADIETPINQNIYPQIGDWVSVYFLDGDVNKPVIRGKLSIMKNNLPNNSNGDQILYQNDKIKIIHDPKENTLYIDSDCTVKVNGHLEISK